MINIVAGDSGGSSWLVSPIFATDSFSRFQARWIPEVTCFVHTIVSVLIRSRNPSQVLMGNSNL